MPVKKIAPYGSWKSPITTELIVSDATTFGDLSISNEGIFWQEMRPTEGGRCTIMCQMSDESTHEIIPKSHNARTRVHEYGGGSYISPVSRTNKYIELTWPVVIPHKSQPNRF